MIQMIVRLAAQSYAINFIDSLSCNSFTISNIDLRHTLVALSFSSPKVNERSKSLAFVFSYLYQSYTRISKGINVK